MKERLPYFDESGHVLYIDKDDEIGIALLGRYAYWRKDFGKSYSQTPLTAYFSNEIAFLNCLGIWNTQGQEGGHHWVYHPARNWFDPR